MRALIGLARDGRLLRTAIVLASDVAALVKQGWTFIAFDDFD